MFVHQTEIEVMREEKDKEIELAKARAEAQQSNGGGGDHERQSQQAAATHADDTATGGVTQATPSEIEAALDELIGEEMCSVCRELLVTLKERPTTEQVRGIMEYGSFKKELSAGADVEELKALLRETDVLQSVFQEKFNGAGTN